MAASARFVKGDIVIMPYPFTDLRRSKRRPAMVLAQLPGKDYIFCSITSQHNPQDRFAVPLNEDDFERGSLKRESRLRPQIIFTVDSTSREIRRIGHLRREKIEEVIRQVIRIFQS